MEHFSLKYSLGQLSTQCARALVTSTGDRKTVNHLNSPFRCISPLVVVVLSVHEVHTFSELNGAWLGMSFKRPGAHRMKLFWLFFVGVLVSCGLTQTENDGNNLANSSQNLDSPPQCRNTNYFVPIAGYYVFEGDSRVSMSFYYEGTEIFAALRICHTPTECQKYLVTQLRDASDYWSNSAEVISFRNYGNLDFKLKFQIDGTVKVSCNFQTAFCDKEQYGRFAAKHEGPDSQTTCPAGYPRLLGADVTHYKQCTSPSGAVVCVPVFEGQASNTSDAGTNFPEGVPSEPGIGGIRNGFESQFMCDEGALTEYCASKSVPNGQTCTSYVEACACACVNGEFNN